MAAWRRRIAAPPSTVQANEALRMFGPATRERGTRCRPSARKHPVRHGRPRALRPGVSRPPTPCLVARKTWVSATRLGMTTERLCVHATGTSSRPAGGRSPFRPRSPRRFCGCGDRRSGCHRRPGCSRSRDIAARIRRSVPAIDKNAPNPAPHHRSRSGTSRR
jgi:hypothetical protein